MVPRRRPVDRPQIEIPELVGRKDDEAPAPGHGTGKVVRGVIVRRDLRACSHPEPAMRRMRAQVDRVLGEQTREIGFGVRGSHVKAQLFRVVFAFSDSAEYLAQTRFAHFDIQGHIVLVEDPSADLRWPARNHHGLLVVEPEQVRPQRF